MDDHLVCFAFIRLQVPGVPRQKQTKEVGNLGRERI